MSFGKRNALSPSQRQYEAASSTSVPNLHTTSGKSWLQLSDLGIGAAVLLVTFVGGLFVSGTFSGQSTPAAQDSAQSQVRTLSSDPTPIPRSYKKDGPIPFVIGTNWKMTFKMQETPDGFDGIDSELHERCMKSVDRNAAQYAEARGKTFLKPEDGAAFLACSMRIYKSRFCESHYRERLVSRLREFVRARREHLAVVDKARNTNMGRMMVEINEAGTKRGGITSGYQPTEFVPTQLAQAIRTLSSDGLLSQSDFSGLFSSTPEELKPYLAADAKSACG